MTWPDNSWHRAVVGAVLLVFCVVETSFVYADGTDIPTEKKDATKKFLKAFATDESGLASKWTGESICSWKYITCADSEVTLSIDHTETDPFTGTLMLPEIPADVSASLVVIKKIAISNLGENLKGSLPANWGNLRALKELLLVKNKLTGSLPAEYKGMGAVTVNLSNNDLEGSIPSEWESWEVTSLDLTHNKLCGCLPVGWKTKAQNTVKVDDRVSADDCATANPCNNPPSPSPSQDCRVPSCATCADNNPSQCVTCDTNYSLSDGACKKNGGDAASVPHLAAAAAAVCVSAVLLVL